MRAAAAICGLVLATAPVAALAQDDVKTAPIPGDGAWTLATVGAGGSGGCFADLSGTQVDTMVMVNRDSKMVMSAGRPDWRLGTAEMQVSLQIDGGDKHALTVSPIDNAFLVLIDDPALQTSLEGAHRITWTLPAGQFSAEVTGLGKAFQVATACGLAAARAVRP